MTAAPIWVLLPPGLSHLRLLTPAPRVGVRGCSQRNQVRHHPRLHRGVVGNDEDWLGEDPNKQPAIDYVLDALGTAAKQWKQNR